MSYHVQNNSQQKSAGFLIVVAFHAVLIVGLIIGLQSNIFPQDPPNVIKPRLIEEKSIPIPLPKPTEPNINQTPKISILPPEIVTTTEAKIETPTFPNQEKIINTTSTTQTKPKIIKATKPEYPIASARLNEEGATGLSLYITAEGQVADIRLDTSSGSARLDDAAIKHAQRNWTFSPCTEGDKPVACWFKTKLVWRLEDAKR